MSLQKKQACTNDLWITAYMYCTDPMQKENIVILCLFFFIAEAESFTLLSKWRHTNRAVF